MTKMSLICVEEHVYDDTNVELSVTYNKGGHADCLLRIYDPDVPDHSYCRISLQPDRVEDLAEMLVMAVDAVGHISLRDQIASIVDGTAAGSEAHALHVIRQLVTR